jgi:hypothetical protein
MTISILSTLKRLDVGFCTPPEHPYPSPFDHDPTVPNNQTDISLYGPADSTNNLIHERWIGNDPSEHWRFFNLLMGFEIKNLNKLI